MPTVTEKTVKAYAHCRDARCEGYSQQEVPALKVLTEQTFAENGGRGSVPGVERSWISFRFANDEDVPCPECGHYREITGSPRPTYQPLSGFSQTGLLGAPKFDPSRQAQARDDRVAELEAKLTEQDMKINRLLTALEGKGKDDG